MVRPFQNAQILVFLFCKWIVVRVERLFEKTRLAKTSGSFKTLVLVPIDTIQNIFEFGQGLTAPVGAQKWPFLGQVVKFYRTPGNCWIFGFLQ
jgi:hypothetical protein